MIAREGGDKGGFIPFQRPRTTAGSLARFPPGTPVSGRAYQPAGLHTPRHLRSEISPGDSVAMNLDEPVIDRAFSSRLSRNRRRRQFS